MKQLALFVVLLTATACQNGSGTPAAPTAATPSGTPSAPTVTTVSVSGTAPNVGATSQFAATAALSDSTTQTVTSQATWASSNASVATVNSAGLVTGVNAGSADISATYQNVTAVSHLTIIRPTFTISGTVRDGTSNGVLPNIHVSSLDSANVTKTTTTNGSGGYSIGGVAAGVVAVTFSATSYQSTTQSITVAADTQVNVSLPRDGNSVPPSTTPITLNGRVIDAATGGPIAGAVVSINGRYRGTTDHSGNFSVPGWLDYGGNHDYTYVSAENYVTDYRYIRGTTQNVRLYRVERIVAGESKLVTIAPDDTLCVNNVQDIVGLDPDYICRSVFVVAPTDGAVTIEAVSTHDGAHPPLEVETLGVSPCCSERMGNPTTIQVRAGTVIVVNVEMLSSSTSARSFVVNTSAAQ